MEPTDFDALVAAAGLTAERPFERVFSQSNDVWLGRSVVLRVTRPERAWASAHERSVLGRLPAALPHAAVVGAGAHRGRAWLALRRLPGQVLGRAWPTMAPAERRTTRSSTTCARASPSPSRPIGARHPGRPGTACARRSRGAAGWMAGDRALAGGAARGRASRPGYWIRRRSSSGRWIVIRPPS